MRRTERKKVAVILVVAMIVSMLPMMEFEKVNAAGDYGISNPRVENGVTTWDCVYFGNYWQNDTNGDGVADKNDEKEPIKWRVLSVDGDDAFLLADKNLDVQRYNDNEEETDVTWETCTLRSWLNGYGKDSNACEIDYSESNFLNNAFSLSEQDAIKNTIVVNEDNPYYSTEGGDNTEDKVYLLSIEEAMNEDYGFTSTTSSSDTRVSVNTAYVADGGEIGSTLVKNENEENLWWLRTPGDVSYCVAVIRSMGYIYSYGFDASYDYPAIRPVLRLNLSASSYWTYAGTVSASTEITLDATEKPTTTPTASDSPEIIRVVYEVGEACIDTPGVVEGIYGQKIKVREDIPYLEKYDLKLDCNTPEDVEELPVPSLSPDNSFLNWNTKSDGTGETYNPGDVYQCNDHVTLYAQYDRTRKIASLPDWTNTFDNYRFLGWFTEPEGGEKLPNPFTLTRDMTIYAQWEKMEIEATAVPTQEPEPIPTKEPVASEMPVVTQEPEVFPTDSPNLFTPEPDLKTDNEPEHQVPTSTSPTTSSSNNVVVEESDEELEDVDEKDEEQEESIEKGDYLISGNLKYKVTKIRGKKGELAVVGVKTKKAKSITIPNRISKGKISFSITSIGKNAFKGCKKVKILKIKSVNIKSIAQKALKGLNEKAKIQVPKSKKKAYKKLLKKSKYSVHKW